MQRHDRNPNKDDYARHTLSQPIFPTIMRTRNHTFGAYFNIIHIIHPVFYANSLTANNAVKTKLTTNTTTAV